MDNIHTFNISEGRTMDSQQSALLSNGEMIILDFCEPPRIARPFRTADRAERRMNTKVQIVQSPKKGKRTSFAEGGAR
jgi:hypothetical protein